MLVAKNNAADHLDKEEAETISLGGDKDDANDAWGDLAGSLSSLEDLYDGAKETYDEAAAVTATALTAKTEASDIEAKITTAYSNADAALNAGTADSVAEAKAAAEATLSSTPDTNKLTLLNTARDAWVEKANDTVQAMTNWVKAEVDDAQWNEFHATADCSGSDFKLYDSGDEIATKAACRLACAALPAWAMTDNLPTGGSATNTFSVDTVTNCYAMSWKSDAAKCKLFGTAIITTDAGGGDDYVCDSRIKSATYAGVVVTNVPLSLLSTDLGVAMTEALTAWGVQSNLVDDAIGKYNMASEYKDLLQIEKEGVDGDADSTGYDGAKVSTADTYTDKKAISDPLLATMDEKKETWDTAIADTATALATLESLTTQVETQTAEEEAQVAIKALADGDHSAQTDAVAGLDDLLETATSDKGDADDDLAAKEGDTSDAQDAYDAAVEDAVATGETIAPEVEALTGLRSDAADAIDALDSALGD